MITIKRQAFENMINMLKVDMRLKNEVLLKKIKLLGINHLEVPKYFIKVKRTLYEYQMTFYLRIKLSVREKISKVLGSYRRS